ncbi:MAG: hypothetical protein WEB52_11130 [Dehalococcoidia bacterium]
MASQEVRQARTALVTERRELAEKIRHIDLAIQALDGVLGTSFRTRTSRNGTSIKLRVYQLLREHGAPMHASAIVDALKAQNVALSEKDPRAVVVTAARRLIKEGRAEKVGPNTFQAVGE